MPFQIWNRRYTGSKYKLADTISNLIKENCMGNTFCDLFAGTAIISKKLIPFMEEVYINDFMYSNEVIYRAFFEQSEFDFDKLVQIKDFFSKLKASDLPSNYISENYGGKFFSYNDSLIIGYIREYIDELTDLNSKEKNILIASLLYSADRVANTVGHYDAFIKGKEISDSFEFDLIEPYIYRDKRIHITRMDSNILAKKIKCDIVYVDPPYNSRQYSRFYHVLENLTCWTKPKLYGEACKPIAENMSEYCRNSATKAFEDLIFSLNCKYIVVSYNNTYNSKSSSSKNKISLETLQNVLSDKGTLSIFERPHQYFNSGKTDFPDHKELIFLVEVSE